MYNENICTLKQKEIVWQEWEMAICPYFTKTGICFSVNQSFILYLITLR